MVASHVFFFAAEVVVAGLLRELPPSLAAVLI